MNNTQSARTYDELTSIQFYSNPERLEHLLKYFADEYHDWITTEVVGDGEIKFTFPVFRTRSFCLSLFHCGITLGIDLMHNTMKRIND